MFGTQPARSKIDSWQTLPGEPQQQLVQSAVANLMVGKTIGDNRIIGKFISKDETRNMHENF